VELADSLSVARQRSARRRKEAGSGFNSRCFSLFFQKFTARGTSSAAENLGFRRFDRRNNSERSTVLALFPAVPVLAKDKIRDNIDISTILGLCMGMCVG
jgi:hypothetical protein